MCGRRLHAGVPLSSADVNDDVRSANPRKLPQQALEVNGAVNVGIHLSFGEKPGRNIQGAWEAGARSLQIFCSSPGAWRAPVLRDRKVAELMAARQQLGIEPVVIHAIYLINLASEDPALVARSQA